MSLKDVLSGIIRDTAYYKRMSLTDLARMLINDGFFENLDAKNKRDTNKISRQFRQSAATLSAESFIKALYVLHKKGDLATVTIEVQKNNDGLAVSCKTFDS